jgi:CubicO group peptidase (beta-lactamase class C family)
MIYPLVFEPGEGFAYGAGVEWAGKAVERLNGNIRLGEYMKTHIWEPLGMNSITFRLSENESVREGVAKLTARLPAGALTAAEAPVWPEIDLPDDCGGLGLYGCATDYIKMLISITTNDGKLLQS